MIGLAVSLAVAAAAWWRSRLTGGYYDAGIYGMTPRAHRAYALVSLGFALFFALALGLGSTSAGVAGLAIYTVVAIFYATSFLRGAADDER